MEINRFHYVSAAEQGGCEATYGVRVTRAQWRSIGFDAQISLAGGGVDAKGLIGGQEVGIAVVDKMIGEALAYGPLEPKSRSAPCCHN